MIAILKAQPSKSVAVICPNSLRSVCKPDGVLNSDSSTDDPPTLSATAGHILHLNEGHPQSASHDSRTLVEGEYTGFLWTSWEHQMLFLAQIKVAEVFPPINVCSDTEPKTVSDYLLSV